MYLGIDPGKSGGLSLVPRHGSLLAPVAYKMPETEMDMFELFEEITAQEVICAVIEKVYASPQMGVTSAFTFGRGKGMLLMAITCFKIPFQEISPQKWQKELGCLTKGDKNISKRKAQQLFPQINITHAIADSLLIAEYCRRENERS